MVWEEEEEEAAAVVEGAEAGRPAFFLPPLYFPPSADILLPLSYID